MIKAVLGLLVAVLVAIFAARLIHRATAQSAVEPIPQPWSQNRMEFVTWNGEPWTAWIHDQRFELLPRQEGKWRRHANTTLAFADWHGQPWQAKLDGEQFLLAPHGDWKGRTERATAIRYRDWKGRPQLRTVPQLRR